MPKKGEVYKCVSCGNIMTIVKEDIGQILCCGQEMELLKEKTIEQEGKEKHVPVIGADGDRIIVNVGSVEHPMEAEHYIQLIQLYDGDMIIAERFLRPGDRPEAVFVAGDASELKAKALCNVHGLWISQ